MTSAALNRIPGLPAMVGFGTLVVAVLLVEAAIRVGLLNQFIVPLPSEIAA